MAIAKRVIGRLSKEDFRIVLGEQYTLCSPLPQERHAR